MQAKWQKKTFLIKKEVGAGCDQPQSDFKTAKSEKHGAKIYIILITSKFYNKKITNLTFPPTFTHYNKFRK